MRWAVVLIAVTACYRAGSELPCTVRCGDNGACPGALMCHEATQRCALANGECDAVDASPVDVLDTVDSPVDSSVPDSSVPSPCVPGSPSAFETIAPGSWFIADRSAPLAAKYDGLKVVVTNLPDTPLSTDFSDPFPPPPANTTYLAPRLAPGAGEMFVTQLDGLRYALAVATRTGSTTFTRPIPIELLREDGVTPVAPTDDVEVTARTTTTPQLMLVSQTGTLVEYVEVTQTQWKRIRTHPTIYGAVIYLGQSTLSANGLRMVFRGQAGAGLVSGYYVDRPDTASVFAAPAQVINSGANLSVATPYLTDDCRHYYYTDPNGGTLQHVELP